MPSSNNILGIGRLTGRLFAAFALGTTLGFAVFIGLLNMLLISCVYYGFYCRNPSPASFISFSYRFYFIICKSEHPKISNVYCWLFSGGWLPAIVLIITLYPGYDRYINPPKICSSKLKYWSNS